MTARMDSLIKGCLMAGLLSACAPNPVSTVRSVVYPASGPLKADVDLRLTGEEKVTDVSWTNEFDAAQVFYLTEDLLLLNSGLTEKGKAALVEEVLSGLPGSRRSFIESEYANLIVERAQGQAKKTLNQVVPKLKEAPNRIASLIKGLPAPSSFASSGNLESSVRAIFKYLKAFDAAIAKSSLMSEVRQGVRAELEKNMRIEPEAMSAIGRLNSAKTLSAAIGALDSAVQKLNLPLPQKTSAQLERGRRLGKAMSDIKDSRQALAAIIDIWLYLSPAERKSQIQTVSAELYEYLNGLDATDLECLKSTDCLSPTQWIAKTIFIQPKIEAYGVQKIRDQLNRKSADSVREVVAQVVEEQLKDLPETLNQKIEKGLKEKVAPVERLASNFSTEFKGRLSRWSQEKFEPSQPAVLSPVFRKAQVSVSEAGQMRLKWTDKPSERIEDQAAFGALAPQLWSFSESNREKSRAVILHQVNDLARDYKNDLKRLKQASRLRARELAESLRAYAQLAMAFDQGSSVSVETVLGKVTAKDLFPDLDSTDLSQPLFPADAFYALSFNGISSLMGTLTSDRSQVFTVDTDKNIDWVGGEDENDLNSIEVMAGVADRFEKGRRSSTARSEDVSRMLIAVCGVYQAVEGATKVNSGLLTEPDETGVAPREQIAKAREKIRLLIIGLANYLSHEFRSEQGLIRHELLASTQTPTRTTYSLLDQALAIRALVRASSELKNDLYHWEASDILMSMNRHMFNRETGFYIKPETRLSPVVLTQTLRALQLVAPHLPEASRRQVERLQKPWLTKVRSWQI